MPAALTTTQSRILEALQRRIDRNDPGPTYRDLCAEFGWASTATARDHLKALAKKGEIQLAGGRARLIRLRKVPAMAARVPVIGQIVAGVPIHAEESREQQIPVPADWVGPGGTYFAVRVTGDSMNGAGIYNGDLVVVRQQPFAKDSDIVVATVNGETTLKRLEQRRRRARLLAENPGYRPLELGKKDTVIQGVVVGLLRLYGPGGATRTL
jgi:repressor LexA